MPLGNKQRYSGLLACASMQAAFSKFRAGFEYCLIQIAIHAIGDKAIDEVAALFQSLPATDGSQSSNTTTASAARRHRVEHAQHLSGPGAAEALREAGVVAVTNPLHLVSDVEIIEARLGKGRTDPSLAFPSRALLQVYNAQLSDHHLHT